MGAVLFTASRALVAGHAVGSLIALDIGFQERVRSRAIRKTVQRASAGAVETTYEGADTIWTFRFEPVRGPTAISRVVEFLRSTAGGERFSVWAYGTEAQPIIGRRRDTGYTQQVGLRGSIPEQDSFVLSFSLIEEA